MNVRFLAAAAVVLIVALIGLAWVADVGPFAPSAQQRIAGHFGNGANCSHAGLADVAGEREDVYRCSWHRPATATEAFPGKYEQACAAWVDGRVYTLPC